MIALVNYFFERYIEIVLMLLIVEIVLPKYVSPGLQPTGTRVWLFYSFQ